MCVREIVVLMMPVLRFVWSERICSFFFNFLSKKAVFLTFSIFPSILIFASHLNHPVKHQQEQTTWLKANSTLRKLTLDGTGSSLVAHLWQQQLVLVNRAGHLVLIPYVFPPFSTIDR